MPVDRDTFMQIRQRVIQTAPPGLSREDFNKLLDSEVAKAAPAPPPQQAAQPTAAPNMDAAVAQIEASQKQRIQQGANLLPAIGGAMGGMVGGVPGAVVGGIGGEAVRQSVLRGENDPNAPQTPIGQVTEMGKAGAMQGASQMGGNVLAAGGSKLASWLMNRATTRVTAKLMQDFPDLSDTLIENALTVSQGGLEKARRMLLAAKAKATVALGKADRAGATVPVELNADLAESLKTAVIEQAIKSGKVPVPKNAPVSVATNRLDQATKDLIAAIDAAADGKPFELTARQADLFKTQLQKESRALYANRNAPNGPRAMEAEATLKADFAAQLNAAIDGIADGYKAANAEAQPLIGATRGIKQAIRPNGNLMQAMVRPAIGMVAGGAIGQHQGNAPLGAAIGAVAGTPKVLSGAAIILRHPLMQQLEKQLPREVWALIEAHLRSEASKTRAQEQPSR